MAGVKERKNRVQGQEKEGRKECSDMYLSKAIIVEGLNHEESVLLCCAVL